MQTNLYFHFYSKIAAMWKMRSRLLASSLILMLSVDTVIIGGSTNKSEEILVSDSRPVAAATKVLEEKYGWIVTYEDPRYEYEGDLIDKTDPAYRRANPNGLRALIPRGGQIKLDYQVIASKGVPASPDTLIQSLLDTNAMLDNPGRFSLTRTGNILHVIPSQVRNQQGRLVSDYPILNTRVTFPEQKRSVLSTLELTVKAISQAIQTKVIIGSVPLSLLMNTEVTQSARNEAARSVLLKSLEATKTPLSWQLFYDPGLKWFALNVHPVRARP